MPGGRSRERGNLCDWGVPAPATGAGAPSVAGRARPPGPVSGRASVASPSLFAATAPALSSRSRDLAAARKLLCTFRPRCGRAGPAPALPASVTLSEPGRAAHAPLGDAGRLRPTGQSELAPAAARGPRPPRPRGRVSLCYA